MSEDNDNILYAFVFVNDLMVRVARSTYCISWIISTMGDTRSVLCFYQPRE